MGGSRPMMRVALLVGLASLAVARRWDANDFMGHEFSSINILHVTDVHSWVSSHRHEPMYNADYGDLASFAERAKAEASRQGKDLFFFNSGDIVDGTGLSDASDVHGQFLLPILSSMPFDALTVGNHELYKDVTVEEIQASKFIQGWQGAYLTSNVKLRESNTFMGNTHIFLHGKHGTRLLVLGFIYDMTDNSDLVIVETVNTTVQQPWFQNVVSSADVDAIVLLTHMGYDSPTLTTLHTATRALRPDLPLVFLAGHTHIRAYERLDADAVVLESGRYFDTVGFLGWDKGDTARNGTVFDQAFVDANVEEFCQFVGVTKTNLTTPLGTLVKEEITGARQALDLDTVLGNSDVHYNASLALGLPDSLWDLYINQVVPQAVFPNTSATGRFVASTGALRYDIFKGNVTRDDCFTVAPFRDAFYRVDPQLSGKATQEVMALLLATGVAEATAMRTPMSSLPDYVVSGTQLKPDESYQLYVPHFDRPAVMDVIHQITGQEPSTQVVGQGHFDSSTIWEQFVAKNWNRA